MEIKEYIRQRFGAFGIQLSDADLLSISMEQGEVTQDNISKIEVAIVRYIPNLLLRPNSISESGFSMSWDKQGMKDFYSIKCKEYGLEDLLNSKPKITFL
jgi:hypothetical protein